MAAQLIATVVQTHKKTWRLEIDSCGTKLRSADRFKSESAANLAAGEIRRGERTMEWVVRKS